VAIVAAAPRPASAQNGADIDLQAFRPAMDSRGMVTVDASQVLRPGDVSFGLVTTWGRGLLRFEEGGARYEVEDMITPTLVGAVGLRLMGLSFEIGAALPFTILAGDRAPDAGGDTADPNDDRSFRFDGQGMADAALRLKLRLRDGARGGLGLALIGSVTLPTASESELWMGEGQAVPQLVAAVDVRRGRLAVAANAGVRWRADRRFRDEQAGGQPMTGGLLDSGPSVPFGLGASIAVLPDRFDVIGEVYGAAPLGGESYFPLEALAGLKLHLARSSFLSFGGGAGLLPGRDANPDARAFLAIVFEPRAGDRDGDGVPDDVDRCPDAGEDRDGFEDEDGCPDPDNDGDGIRDPDDGCPDEPEDRDGFQDEDGCPDRDDDDRDDDGIRDPDDGCPDDPEDADGFADQDGCPDPDNDGDHILDVDDLCIDKPETHNTVDDEDGCPDRGPVVELEGEIQLLEVVQFEFDSAEIKEESFGILRAVAMTIRQSKNIERVEVQGHTDERGAAAYNLDLSRRRAEAVVDFLVASGASRDQLVARGYGETRPVVRGRGERAWTANRRVQFIVARERPR
jgi:outer membrane protein OmpA-like peptidoglycan-associated protein